MTASSCAIDRHCAELLAQGYCIIPSAVPEATIAQLDADLALDFATTPTGRGGFYGERTTRLGRLLSRSDQTASLVQHPLILGIVERVLKPWCDTLQLNVAQAIAVGPGAEQQMPHRDQDMWRAPPDAEYLVNAMWPLTPFRADNGATLLWPGSHGPCASSLASDTDPVAAVMAPGSALLFLGSTLHAAGANRTDMSRRGVIIGYALGWLKPYENQWLAYPPAVARRFPTALAALVGYQQHRPNLGNYEGQCPSILLRGCVGAAIGAVDALRPDQAEQVARFVAVQRSGG